MYKHREIETLTLSMKFFLFWVITNKEMDLHKYFRVNINLKAIIFI